MIRKTLSVPFWLISGILKLIARVVGSVLSLGLGTFRLIVSRMFGVLFGVLIGFFLGKKHLRVKLFTGKRK